MPATKAPKGKNRYSGLSYFAPSLMKEADKPILSRRELPIGRNEGETVMRRFHIQEHEIDQLKAAARDGDVFPNPHNSGCYHFILEALKALGPDRRHSWDLFYAKVKELMSEVKQVGEDGKTVSLWQRFSKKESRSDKGLDVDGRLQQNCEVLQRTGIRLIGGVPTLSGKTPYGYRINQVAQEVLRKPGASIDIELEGVKTPRKFIMLNLHPKMYRVALPNGESIRLPLAVNQTKKRRGSEDSAVKVVKAVKSPAVKAEREVSPKAEKAAPKRKSVKRKAKAKVEAPQTETVAVVSTEPEVVAATAEATAAE